MSRINNIVKIERVREGSPCTESIVSLNLKSLCIAQSTVFRLSDTYWFPLYYRPRRLLVVYQSSTFEKNPRSFIWTLGPIRYKYNTYKNVLDKMYAWRLEPTSQSTSTTATTKTIKRRFCLAFWQQLRVRYGNTCTTVRRLHTGYNRLQRGDHVSTAEKRLSCIAQSESTPNVFGSKTLNRATLTLLLTTVLIKH